MDDQELHALAARLLPPPGTAVAVRDSKTGQFIRSSIYKGAGMLGDFGRACRELTGDNGEALAALAWGIAIGDITVKRYVGAKGTTRVEVDGTVTNGPELVDVEPTISERQEAIRFLAEYGHGKPRQALEISGPDGQPIEVHDLSRLSLEELLVYKSLTEKAKREQPTIDITP